MGLAESERIPSKVRLTSVDSDLSREICLESCGIRHHGYVSVQAHAHMDFTVSGLVRG